MISYLEKFNSNEDKANKKKEMLEALKNLPQTNKVTNMVEEIPFLKDTYSINYDIRKINAMIGG